MHKRMETTMRGRHWKLTISLTHKCKIWHKSIYKQNRQETPSSNRFAGTTCQKTNRWDGSKDWCCHRCCWKRMSSLRPCSCSPWNAWNTPRPEMMSAWSHHSTACCQALAPSGRGPAGYGDLSAGRANVVRNDGARSTWSGDNWVTGTCGGRS